MKKNRKKMLAICAVTSIFLSASLHAQEDKDKMLGDCKEAKTTFIKSDESMNNLFHDSYGYVIFPKISKGAVVVGGAGGNGEVYEQGKKIGTAKMVQVSAGAQVGGETYREVIFFETKDALDRFKENKIEFTGQLSAVAVKSGVSATTKYREGVEVFTQEIGGLMAEASLNGQKFTFYPI